MPALKKVVITADRTTIQTGESALLTATPQDAKKQAVAAPVTFGVSDPTKGTLTNAGTRKVEVRGTAPGYVTVDATATLNGVKVTGSLRLTVKAAPPPVPKVVTVDVALSATAVDVGDTLQATATPRDAAGSPVAGKTATWTTSDAARATIDAQGRVSAATAGTVSVRATVDRVTGTATLAIADPIVVVGTPSVALAISRFDGQSGDALVTTGIPLPPGALRPGQEPTARVAVAGVDVPLYAAALASRYPDGSIRALLIQFRVTALGATESRPATLTLGGAPRAPALLLAAPIAVPGSDAARGGSPLGLPQAAALPMSVAYLLVTDLVGATISRDSARALGGAFAKYEADFDQFSEYQWTATGATWNDGNYYDRALVYDAAWVRSANPVYWARAQRHAAEYRDGYLVPGGYSASAHWSLLEGLEKHYLLTGDEASRVAVVMTANRLTNLLPEYYGPISGDAREMGRYIIASLLAWRLTPPGVPAPAWSMNSGFNPIPDWSAYLDVITGKALAWQTAAGTWPSDGICKGQLNYMVAILNTALIKAYEQWKPDPRFVDAVKRSADYLMTTQWRPEAPPAGAFNYANVVCTTGTPDPAADLGGFFVDAYGWLWRRTGDAKYRTFGEQAFAGSVAGAYLWGGKQFNQQYHTSFRYLGYR